MAIYIKIKKTWQKFKLSHSDINMAINDKTGIR